MPEAQISVTSRMKWMDLLRGTAIAFVLLWHAVSIPLLYDIAVPEVITSVNDFLLPFRMPVLMFLSGMLLPASLRKPLPTYYAGKLRFVAYPLVIWTVIHFFVYQPPTTLLSFTFWTTSYLWFLAYILAYYLGAPLVKWIPTWILIVLPLLVTPFVDADIRRRFFFLAAFFFLGKLATEHRRIFDRIIASRWTLLAAPFAIGFGVYSAVIHPIPHEGVFAVFSVAGVLCGVKVAQAVADQRWTRSIRFVGRHSLIYYVTHFPVIIGVILLGDRVLGIPIAISIAIGFFVAASVGTACAWLAETTVLRWVFIAPKSGDLARFRGRRVELIRPGNPAHQRELI